MKLVLIIFFAVLAIILGFGVSSLQKELLSERNKAVACGRSNDDLRRELIDIKRVRADQERLLDEIEQSIALLENKVDFKKLERYIPKKTWSEIKPIIDRLRGFQEVKEN